MSPRRSYYLSISMFNVLVFIVLVFIVLVFIKGIIDRLVKDFGLVLKGVVVYHVPGVPGTVCSGGLAGFRVPVDAGGEGVLQGRRSDF